MSDFDAIVVGAGCAGNVAAYTLASAGKSVLVVERGNYAGAKNITGGRIYTHSLAKVFPNYQEAPLQRKVTHERISLMSPDSNFTVDYSARELEEAGKESYTVLRGPFDQWLAEQAENAGAEYIYGIAVENLIIEDGKVKGIDAFGDAITSDVVILAEVACSAQVGEGWNQKRDDFNNYHASLDATNKTIIFRHDIDTDIMYAKREITIRVTNQDGLSRDWVVTQYPDMYIEGESNESRGGYNRFVYGVRETSNSGSSSVSDDNGSTRDNNLGGVYGYQNSDSNRNPNQYTIYVTALDSDSEYAIGDPRESTSVTARSLDLSDKTDYRRTHLQTYSLARGRDAANIIAPAFKIASSWGKTLPLSFEQAEKRCASYQENGYPAGRWRIPTEAEVAYVIKLSEDGKIPQLFDDAYWTSSGTSYGTSSQGTAVRCVYDVWYWGDQKEGDAANNYESFYWGSQTPSSN